VVFNNALIMSIGCGIGFNLALGSGISIKTGELPSHIEHTSTSLPTETIPATASADPPFLCVPLDVPRRGAGCRRSAEFPRHRRHLHLDRRRHRGMHTPPRLAPQEANPTLSHTYTAAGQLPASREQGAVF
jgi:hypothetical protein